MDFIMLSLARVVSQFPAQYFGKLPGLFLTFESLLGFREFFPRFSPVLPHVVYEVCLVSYLFFSFQIWYFRK